MKILWVSPHFLHPTTTGGRIRTLQILRHLHSRHEVHFAALSLPGAPEGPLKAGEYSSRSCGVPHSVADKRSAAFLGQVAKGLFSPVPLAVSRFYSPALARGVLELTEHENYDRQVCDFLAAAPHLPDLSRAVLFQHNVETVIWRRRAQHAADPLTRTLLRVQADRMYRYERQACRTARTVVAVSPVDVRTMREMFGVTRIHEIPTGVDVDYFMPAGPSPPASDLLYVGSMDWAPNVDAVKSFLRDILPLIHRRRPQSTFAVVGRDPPPELVAAARNDPRVTVTGTVADVRPYLWGAKVAVVPLRVGGGTRLKIYECMAARTPVVSTHVGAEGLEVSHPETIRLADAPDQFARACLELMESDTGRARMAEAAWQLVSSKFSSRQVALRFEELLEAVPTKRSAV